MKKLIALLLALMLCLSFAACNGKEAAQPAEQNGEANAAEESEAAAEEAAETPALPAETWVNLYSGWKLTLNSDGTLTFGDYSGTWTLEDKLLTIKYMAANEIERSFDLTEENGAPLLRGHLTAKINGEQSKMSVTDLYPEDKIAEVKAAVAKKPGDTVSTDIIELTVNEAALAYYAKGASTGSDGKTANVEEANSPAEGGGLYTAAKGRCLTCIDFTIKNTDRGSMNTNDYVISFSAVQGEKYGNVNGYDLNVEDGTYGLNLWNAPIAYDGGDFYTNDTSNDIINAGQTAQIKYVGIAGFEADLSAPFDLIVYLKNSSSETETFVYTIGG